MNKKSILLIIVILIAIIGFLLVSQSNIIPTSNTAAGNEFKVGAATFSMPEGYHMGETTKNLGHINITNGYNTIFLSEYNNTTNVKKFVDEYNSDKKNDNSSVDNSNFTVSKIRVYKSTLSNDTGVIHYWFSKDHNVYTIYTWDGSSTTDNVVKDLIKSLK